MTHKMIFKVNSVGQGIVLLDGVDISTLIRGGSVTMCVGELTQVQLDTVPEVDMEVEVMPQCLSILKEGERQEAWNNGYESGLNEGN